MSMWKFQSYPINLYEKGWDRGTNEWNNVAWWKYEALQGYYLLVIVSFQVRYHAARKQRTISSVHYR